MTRGLSQDRQSGRWRIICRDGTLVYFYRAVAEVYVVERPLRDDEEVHHRNEDPADDRPGNLEVLTKAQHRKRHQATRAGRCRRGHPLVDAYEIPATGHLQCSTCRAIRRRRERLRKEQRAT